MEKFQKLSMAKFSNLQLINPNKIFGGLMALDRTAVSVPSGGCSCHTEGGTMQLGSVPFTYCEDDASYNSDGTAANTEYHTTCQV